MKAGDDDAKLVFGTVFSLRNMVRKLGGEEDKYDFPGQQTRQKNNRTTGLTTHSSFVSYSTSQYKLHYYETPTNIKFVMLTDLKSPSMRLALQQIYINLFVEYGMSSPSQRPRPCPTVAYCHMSTNVFVDSSSSSNLTRYLLPVVKNPLSPIEHPGGVGVNNELFEESLEQFVVCSLSSYPPTPFC